MGRLLLLLLLLTPAATNAQDGVLEGKPRIIDGDTIEIAGKKIHLYGIDAPEMAQTCKTRKGKAQKCGVLSKQFLSDFLKNQSVTCKGKGNDERDANPVAVCTIGWMDINEQIVMEGWAIANREESDDYVRAEDYAKIARRGLWKTEFTAPSAWRRQ